MKIAKHASALVAALVLMGLSTSAANIITFDDNANSCGGSVMCSTDGTTGYINSGSGQAFDLSTIGSWFQIDANGMNSLTTQTEAEPDMGAGGFLVLNNTGSTVTTFSLTLADTFTSTTPSVNFCSGSSGPLCDQFQDNKGAGAPGGATEELSGSNIFSCSTASLVGDTCASSGANASAEFEPGTVTYTWSGLDIANRATFDLDFASWNNSASVVRAPEPGTLSLLATGLLSMMILGIRRRTTQN